MVENRLIQSQELKQEQILAPQQIHSLEILQAPLLELQEKISLEIERNPLLEQEQPAAEDLVGDFISEVESASDSEEKKGDSGDDDKELSELFQLADSWQDYLPNQSRSNYSSVDDEKRMHFFNSLAEEQSLQDQLLEQLRMIDVPDRRRELAELVVGSIDDQGYLRSHLADLAIAGNAELAEVEDALKLVQSFEPSGIGARNLRECLMIQLERKGKKGTSLYNLVKNHLDDLAKNRLPQVAKKMRITIDELYRLSGEIRELTPHPGSSVSSGNPIFVIPEVIVEEKEGEFVVVCKDDNLPKLRISSLYRKLLEDETTPSETKNYIRGKLTNGKMLIKSIEQRQSTIRRIAEVIVDTQYDFLKEGIEHLRPLTMQQVADKLDLHETTISRAISSKYIQTPTGLFEFRFFFTSGYQAEDGEELSSRSVKEKIREMILDEDSAKPLSDLKIAQLLKESGLPIARRTVAKYREEMGIQASHLRKEF